MSPASVVTSAHHPQSQPESANKAPESLPKRNNNITEVFINLHVVMLNESQNKMYKRITSLNLKQMHHLCNHIFFS